MMPGPGWGAAAAKRAQPSATSSLSLILMAVWFGLAAGLLELALLVVRVHGFEKGFFLRSRHFIWMVPASDVMILGTWGLLLAVVSRRGWRLSPRAVIASFLFLACMSLLLLVRGLHAVTCVLMSVGIAYRTALSIATDPRLPRLWRLIRVTAPVFAGILAALLGTAIARDWHAGRRLPNPSPSGPNPAPNVLLIVLDTVRADHLSLHGYNRDTTPNLTRLASDGVHFRRARAPAPWTLPSHASLFTGRWPHDLLVERLGWLDGTHTTLAEFLGRRGYSTGGFVANSFFCGHESGLSRGFQTYRDYPVTPGDVFRASSLGWFLARNVTRAREELLWAMTTDGPAQIGLDFPRKPAAAVNREFLDWLDHRDQRPFFTFLNFFDAHDPYLPPDRPSRPFGRIPEVARAIHTAPRLAEDQQGNAGPRLPVAGARCLRRLSRLARPRTGPIVRRASVAPVSSSGQW